jgi:hypothetical protein
MLARVLIMYIVGLSVNIAIAPFWVPFSSVDDLT